jgi:hypothetical protein
MKHQYLRKNNTKGSQIQASISIICDLFSATVHSPEYNASVQKMMNEESFRKNLKESGRILISGTIPAFAWTD